MIERVKRKIDDVDQPPRSRGGRSKFDKTFVKTAKFLAQRGATQDEIGSGAVADWKWKAWKGHHTKLSDAQDACTNTDSLECELRLPAYQAKIWSPRYYPGWRSCPHFHRWHSR